MPKINFKNHYFWLAICWAFFVYISMTSPLKGAGSPFPGYDKIVHVILFGVLNYLLVNAIFYIKETARTALAISLAASFIYAVSLERLQDGILGRFSSIYDTAAGLIGIALSGVYFYYFEKNGRR